MAEDFLQDLQVRQWLDGVERAWTLLSLDSLGALRQEPSAVQTMIRIANDLSTDEITGSPMARNTLSRFAARHYYRKSALFDRMLAFNVKMDFAKSIRH